MNSLLNIKNLNLGFRHQQTLHQVLHDLSFQLEVGETLAIVGESGSGKSITALSIAGLLPPQAEILSGSISLKEKDILSLALPELQQLRRNSLSMIFQEPIPSLNPVLTVEEQLVDSLRLRRNIKKKAARSEAKQLLEKVHLRDSERVLASYPFQLSGGMCQRIGIALALCSSQPGLLIADEPTTALDVTVQAQVLAILKELQEKNGYSLLLITHDMGVVYQMADRVLVLYMGCKVEEASSKTLFQHARHPYTVALLNSLPQSQLDRRRLDMISGQVPEQKPQGCPFVDRCQRAKNICREEFPQPQKGEDDGHTFFCHNPLRYEPRAATSKAEVVSMDSDNILEIKDLNCSFTVKKNGKKSLLKAVRSVSLALKKGEVLGIVGESGCGKSTLARCIMQLQSFQKGDIFFEGEQINSLSPAQLMALRRQVQIVFQDPLASLNPRKTTQQLLLHPLKIHEKALSTEQMKQRLLAVLEEVGLGERFLHRYPHQMSGGQRQRLSIARALILKPELLICDESVSALDLSVQAQIINLLLDLKEKRQLSYLFISHDLSVIEFMSDRALVIYLGRIVEEIPTSKLREDALHPYTQKLLAASLDTSGERKTPSLSQMQETSQQQGCHFANRCPKVFSTCHQKEPELQEVMTEHRVACWLYSAQKNQ